MNALVAARSALHVTTVGNTLSLGCRLRRPSIRWVPSNGPARGSNWCLARTLSTEAGSRESETASGDCEAAEPSSEVHPSASSGQAGTEITARRVDRLPLSGAVQQNLYGMGLTKLTEIQARAFDPIRRGQDFFGRAPTGSGKTIAYLLPVLERVRHQKMDRAHSVLVLVPSRELAKQVGSAILSIAVGTDVALVHSGSPLHVQEELVRLGPKVVVSTPGRCATMIERGSLEVKNIQILVIDEVDALLGHEFRGRVERVLSSVRKQSLQTVMFSASVSEEVKAAIRRFAPKATTLDLVDRRGFRKGTAVLDVEHVLCRVPGNQKGRHIDTARMRVLVHLLDSRLSLSPGSRCIIFSETTTEAKTLLAHPAMNTRARAVHPDLSEQERDAVLTAFANREFDTLIATDIVARGVDFLDVALVLIVRPPRDPTQYVHRAGRTGRAGAGGTVITLYDPQEHKLVQRVREVTRQKFVIEGAPGPGDIHHAAVSRILDDLHGVKPEDYEPFLSEAEQLLKERGSEVLATAMAVLDARHADLKRADKNAPSLLSGRQGFVCLLIHDPEHEKFDGAAQVRNSMMALLPKSTVKTMGSERAGQTFIGRAARSSDGWVVDVDQRFAGAIAEDVRTGRKAVNFEIRVARQMPRLSRTVASRSSRKTPWANARRSVLKKQAQESSLRRTRIARVEAKSR